MERVTPLFVTGMGRSGTTNALRVLNCHPKVMLNGEIALPVLKRFFALLEILDQTTGGDERMEDDWRARKADYMFSSFGYLAKLGRGRLDKLGEATYLGHKSPRLEMLFGEYEEHFGSAGLKPRYVYCTRNPFDCWRSYSSQSWNSYDGVGQFLNDYGRSHRRLRRMQNTIPDRVFVVALDALKAAPDPFAFYSETLYAPLGLEIDDKTRRRIAKVHFEAKRGSASRTLGAEDRARIEDYLSASEKNAADSA